MDLSRDALRHSGRMWRHTEDSGGGVMRFVCSLDRLQVVATRKAAEFGSPCPRRSQRPCSISSALLSAGVLSKLRPLVSFRLYLLPLVRTWRSIVENSWIWTWLTFVFGFDSALDGGREFLDGKAIYVFVSIILENNGKRKYTFHR